MKYCITGTQLSNYLSIFSIVCTGMPWYDDLTFCCCVCANGFCACGSQSSSSSSTSIKMDHHWFVGYLSPIYRQQNKDTSSSNWIKPEIFFLASSSWCLCSLTDSKLHSKARSFWWPLPTWRTMARSSIKTINQNTVWFRRPCQLLHHPGYIWII